MVKQICSDDDTWEYAFIKHLDNSKICWKLVPSGSWDWAAHKRRIIPEGSMVSIKDSVRGEPSVIKGQSLVMESRVLAVLESREGKLSVHLDDDTMLRDEDRRRAVVANVGSNIMTRMLKEERANIDTNRV